jgi:hypothetical protein
LVYEKRFLICFQHGSVPQVPPAGTVAANAKKGGPALVS